MLVLVGLIVQMATSGNDVWCDPKAIFFVFVTGTFILCGVLHPREWVAVLCGFAYYLAIPTMYMILMIYSVCNLNNVSWGTREDKPTQTAEQLEEAKKQEEAMKKEKEKLGLTGKIYGFFGFQSAGSQKESCWKKNCGCCCPDRSAVDYQLGSELAEVKIELTEVKILVKSSMDAQSENMKKQTRLLRQFVEGRRSTANRQVLEEELEALDGTSSDPDYAEDDKPEREMLIKGLLDSLSLFTTLCPLSSGSRVI